MLTFSVVIISMFLAVQWGFAKMPLLPLRIFRYRTVALVFASCLCQGWVHYGQIFYLPVSMHSARFTVVGLIHRKLYFQEILGHSSIMSGVLLIPMVALQPFVSTACGQVSHCRKMQRITDCT